MKTCSKCGEEKDVGEFRVKHNQCRVCEREYQSKYEKTEKRRAAKRKYKQSENGRAATRKYWESEKGKGVRRKYKQSEKGRVAQCRSVNKPKNRNRIRLRNRLHRFLIKGFDTQKSRDVIGCTSNELRTRITILFRTGMSWDNYGEWEFDHIVPMSKFDLTKDEEVKKCMHYSNLQPLWKWENKLKGNN